MMPEADIIEAVFVLTGLIILSAGFPTLQRA